MVTLPPEIVELTESDRSVNMCIYGDSGAGKTVLAGSSNNLFLASDPGTISAAIQGSSSKLWKTNTWDQFDKAIKWLERNPKNGFDWIVCDSVTKMQGSLIRWILNTVHDENASRDLDIPALPDHQKWQHMFKRYVERLISLPQHVLFTATVMRAEDSEGDDIVMPELQGKNGTTDPAAMSHWFCASMTTIGYLARDGEDRTLMFNASPYITKDRLDVFTEPVEITRGGKQVTTMADIGRKVDQATEIRPAAAPRKATPTRRRGPAKRVSA